jgi:hypothetical protein
MNICFRMSGDQPKDLIPLWGGVIHTEPQVIDNYEEARLAPIQKQLAKFSEHKEVLLSCLRKAYDRGPKTKPFERDKLWVQIEGLAHLHYMLLQIEQETVSPAERKTRYSDIANALGRAHSLIEEAMRSTDLEDDLINSWWLGTTEYAEANGRFVDVLYIVNEFKKKIAELAALQSAAARAAEEVQRGRGRPKGTSVLPSKYIRELARLYRGHTGLKPGAGQGPFARFAMAYLTAIGHGNVGSVTEATLIDIIKDIRSGMRRNSTGGRPSRFEE